MDRLTKRTSMKYLQSLCTLALSAASASAFAVRPAVIGSLGVLPSNTAAAHSYSQTTALHMSAASDFAQKEIDGNKVVVFSKSFCPFCKKTKNLFKTLNVDATVYELNEMDDGADIQDALLEMTGQKTVPNVFINGKHVGGNDAVQAANKSGDLKSMLEG